MTTLAYFSFAGLLSLLIWGALAAMSFWIWSATKAKAPLLTLIGSGILAFVGLDMAFMLFYTDIGLFIAIGSALVVLGYYYTVKPTVDAHVKALAAKTKHTGSGTPPAAS